MTKPVSIIVIDDHPLYRAGVVRTLAEAPDLLVAGEGGSAHDALQLAEKAKPSIALLDISMPGNGIEAARAIAQAHRDIAIIMLTASEDESDIMDALAAGARGYILKGASAQELLLVVRLIASGGSYVSPALAGRMLVAMKNKSNNDAASGGIDTLTAREEQILRLVAVGKSNKEIGRNLGLQEKTVKHYMTGILQKLQVRNRTEAALLARDNWN